MAMRKTRTAVSAVALCGASLVLLAGPASLGSAEVFEQQGVRVSVTGKMTPTALPRSGTVPIGVSFGGEISSRRPDGPPKLTKLTIAINRQGRLDTRGLPRCRLGHIDPSTTREAYAACRSALVGEGSFSANVKIPEQSPFPSEGKVLAFNGRLRGKPAILAHIYGTKPVPTSYVLPFEVRRSGGTYGTLLEASLPDVTGEWGYVTGIAMSLQRRYSFHGESRGYLNAGCPAPRGISRVGFPLARTSFVFEGGLTLAPILNRTCKVRG